jgi:hypothetical protein
MGISVPKQGKPKGNWDKLVTLAPWQEPGAKMDKPAEGL